LSRKESKIELININIILINYINMSLIFVEKYGDPIPHKLWADDYQPQEFDQMLGNENVVETLKNFLVNGQIPHLTLCGPHGCGKTTMAKILVNRYLGNYVKSCSMEVIGSIYRGKNIVTEKVDKKKTSDKSSDGPNIVNFIRKTAKLPDNKCKIVTIYDFDCMTNEAQMALRRIIEIYSNKVRFIFICNELGGVIEAIQSRSLILKCNILTIDQIKLRLEEIYSQTCDKSIKNICEGEVYESIAIMSNGDLKQAINCLQVFSSCSQRTIDNFYHLFNIPSIKIVNEMITYCLNNDSKNAFETLNQLINNGYNVSDILDIIIKVLSYSKTLTDAQRVKFIEETIKIICINEISSSTLHLYKLLVRFIQQ
jgi:DNA polymerase III delta prime subunit